MNLKYLIAVVLGLISCGNSTEKISGNGFEDIKGFFEKEEIRLSKANRLIQKTVSGKYGSETKTFTNINWKSELNLFRESDINKSAWKSSYKVIKEVDKIIYIALDSNLHTRQLLISKDVKGKIKHVEVFNKTENFLCHSYEHLTYIPDSIYQIDKTQETLIIGKSRYVIKGNF